MVHIYIYIYVYIQFLYIFSLVPTVLYMSAFLCCLIDVRLTFCGSGEPMCCAMRLLGSCLELA